MVYKTNYIKLTSEENQNKKKRPSMKKRNNLKINKPNKHYHIQEHNEEGVEK